MARKTRPKLLTVPMLKKFRLQEAGNNVTALVFSVGGTEREKITSIACPHDRLGGLASALIAHAVEVSTGGEPARAAAGTTLVASPISASSCVLASGRNETEHSLVIDAGPVRMTYFLDAAVLRSLASAIQTHIALPRRTAH